MTTSIFDKTDKGREEIATRKYHLASRLRTLLVLIDGKKNSDELLKKLAGMGLDETSVAELQRDGFIHETSTEGIQASPTSATTNDPASNPLPPGQNQFEAIYHFYNETIKSTVGLRGYPLQLKVERANSIEDFRKLRQHYLEVVQKAKGHEMARSLRDRLDQLLYLGETVPPDTVLNESNMSAK